MCGAETFPSFHVSGTFLPDVPGFQVPPDSIFPPQQLGLPIGRFPSIFNFTTALIFCCIISSFDVPEPFQPSSHNHRYRFHLCFLLRSANFSVVLTGSPPLPIAPLSSLLLPCALIFAMFRRRKATSVESLSGIYQYLQVRWNCLVANHSVLSIKQRI